MPHENATNRKAIFPSEFFKEHNLPRTPTTQKDSESLARKKICYLSRLIAQIYKDNSLIVYDWEPGDPLYNPQDPLQFIRKAIYLDLFLEDVLYQRRKLLKWKDRPEHIPIPPYSDIMLDYRQYLKQSIKTLLIPHGIKYPPHGYKYDPTNNM